MFLGFIIFGLVFVSLLVYFLVVFDGFFGGYDFTSSKAVFGKVSKIISDRHLDSGKFYDLGSCRGGFALRLARRFPKLDILGIDNNRLRVFCSKIRALFFKNLKFVKQDIFAVNVSDADAVYLYLPQELMPALQTKLQKELKPGGVVISTSVHFANWQPSEIYITHQDKPDFERIFVYYIA
jgi:trans-aconitate methyltransferase